MTAHEPARQFVIPFSVITMSDLSKLIYELDGINNFFLQANARQPGMTITPPKTTPEMEDIFRLNGLNQLDDQDRLKLKTIMDTLRDKTPTIHMSFSVSPNRRFLEKIIAWMRKNIHPLIILHIGLQPNIGAGFTLRTNNHFFDFSLRQRLNKNANLLIAELEKETTP